jgi:hypothetical protein
MKERIAPISLSRLSSQLRVERRRGKEAKGPIKTGKTEGIQRESLSHPFFLSLGRREADWPMGHYLGAIFLVLVFRG